MMITISRSGGSRSMMRTLRGIQYQFVRSSSSNSQQQQDGVRSEIEESVKQHERQMRRQMKLREKRERAKLPSEYPQSQARRIVDTLLSEDYQRFMITNRGNDEIIPVVANAVNMLLEDHGFRKRSNEMWYERHYPLWYLANRHAPTVSLLVRIFKELSLRSPSFKPSNVLDFNAKLGAGFVSSRAVWGEAIQRYVALEPNKRFRSLGESFVQEIDGTLFDASTFKWEESFNDNRLPASDLVVAAYSLGDVDTRQVVSRLWAKVNPNGVLVILETGSSEGHLVVQRAREFILDKYDSESVDASQRAHILSPCPHHLECPLSAQKKRCSFGHRVLKSSFPNRSPQREWVTKGRMGGIIIENFSYIVVRKGAPEAPYDLTALAESPPPPPSDQVHNWSRIVHPLRRKKQMIELPLCRPNGKYELKSIGKVAYKIPGAYKLAKKMRWGDLWQFPMPGDKEYDSLTKALRGFTINHDETTSPNDEHD